MHPNAAKGKDSVWWDFPYIFDVFLCTPYTDKMFTVKRAALTGQTVDYAGGSAQSFFKDGNPVYIKMDLAFTELDLLTRDDIYKNY